VVLPALCPAARSVAAQLPVPWREGHTLDVSPDAAALMDTVTAGDWRGAVIFPDYGKTLREFLDAVPLGSARAYRNHTQSNALLAAPGEQDLTYHVAWDTLQARLVAAGFTGTVVERQEAFLMKRASGELERRFNAGARTRDPAAMAVLRELVHPAHFGGKFQVLSGVRL
jgi:SAM-dependent MidA family methyltransferase